MVEILLEREQDVHGGGAGNPGGLGKTNSADNGKNGTGGLLIMYAKNIINNGSIDSKGSEAGYGTNKWSAGGSSGGGSINIFYTLNYSGNIPSAEGGKAVEKGGKGGDGSVTIGNIATGTFVEK